MMYTPLSSLLLPSPPHPTPHSSPSPHPSHLPTPPISPPLTSQEIVVTQEEDTQATASAEVINLESRIADLVANIKTIEQHKSRWVLSECDYINIAGVASGIDLI